MIFKYPYLKFKKKMATQTKLGNWKAFFPSWCAIYNYFNSFYIENYLWNIMY